MIDLAFLKKLLMLMIWLELIGTMICFLDSPLVIIFILDFSLLSLLLTILTTLMIFLLDKCGKAFLILKISLTFPLDT